jgi:hypothetical protein
MGDGHVRRDEKMGRSPSSPAFRGPSRQAVGETEKNHDSQSD